MSRDIVAFDPRKSDDPFVIHSIKWRMKTKKKTWLGSCIGESGDGKSYGGIRIAELIDPNFNATRIALDPLRFLEILKTGLPPCSVVLFDEAGINLSAKEFQTMNNRLINYVVQAFRKKRIAVIFTMPTMKLLDKASRELCNSIIYLQNVDMKNKMSEAKWYNIQMNHRTGKSYEKSPRYIDPKKGLTVVPTVNIRLPNSKTLEEYEKMKDGFIDGLTEDVYKSVKSMKDFNRNKSAIIEKLTERIAKDIGKEIVEF